jgi:hypothetical protein
MEATEMDDSSNCDLITPFELHGRWWRAETDQHQSMPGCLSYTPDHGLQLQLYDGLQNEGFFLLLREVPHKPIWGEVNGFAGQQIKVSLFNTIQTNRPNDPKMEGKPFSHTIYYVNRAIIGTHALSPAALRLLSVRFSVVDFEEFANTEPIAPLSTGRKITVDYTIPDPLEVAVADPEMRVIIRTRVKCSGTRSDHNLTMTYTSEMELTPSSPMPFEDGMQTIFSIVNLLHLCAREAVELRSITAVLDSGESVASFALMRKPRGNRPSTDWLLTIREMEDRFGNVLNAWFSVVNRLRFVAPVFFSELTGPSSVQDARFFHFAGCLEAFHREVVQAEMGKFLPRRDYREIIKSLLDHLPTNVPEPLTAAMRSALSHANDHSFAERIEALFNTLEPETQCMLTDDANRFLAAIKHSRNKLAHIVDEPDGETFEGKEFAYANLSLRGWLTILMLKECGVAEVLLRERMKAIDYFYWGPFKFQ